MFLQLTCADSGHALLVFFGTGGVIKVEEFPDTENTELCNADGDMVAKVTEDRADIVKLGLK